LIADDKIPSAAFDERLETLYRENVKLCEQVSHIIEGKSNDMNLLDSLNVLAGLREASEKAPVVPKVSRPVKKGAKASVPEGVPEEGVSSPRIRIGAGASKDKGSRAGSVSVSGTRETSVKLEDGAESVASSTDGVTTTASSKAISTANASAAGGKPTNRFTLTKGEVVYCRHPTSGASRNSNGADAPEGEGILCRVTAVIGEGKQRRYEVQDADTSGPAPAPPQRASVSQLIKIPESNEGLGGLERRRGVLAMYPDTTTFYKAEVSEVWSGEGKAKANEMVKLNFQDDEVVREVERRFVLSEK